MPAISKCTVSASVTQPLFTGMACKACLNRFGLAVHLHTLATVLKEAHCGVEETVVPGATKSGLNLPSVVGPMEEKYARLSYLAADTETNVSDLKRLAGLLPPHNTDHPTGSDQHPVPMTWVTRAGPALYFGGLGTCAPEGSVYVCSSSASMAPSWMAMEMLL